MRKIIFLVIIMFLMSFLYISCTNKSVLAPEVPANTPTITNTPTPVYTPTNTATPSYYSFDTSVAGWGLASTSQSWDDAGVSLTLNTDPTYIYSGSGSAAIYSDFTPAVNSHQVVLVKSFPVNTDLEYNSFSVHVYCPAGLVDPVNPYKVRIFFTVASGSGYYGYSQNITAEGWYDLTYNTTSFYDYFTTVREVGVMVEQDLSSTVDYVGYIYVDEFQWQPY